MRHTKTKVSVWLPSVNVNVHIQQPWEFVLRLGRSKGGMSILQDDRFMSISLLLFLRKRGEGCSPFPDQPYVRTVPLIDFAACLVKTLGQ